MTGSCSLVSLLALVSLGRILSQTGRLLMLLGAVVVLVENERGLEGLSQGGFGGRGGGGGGEVWAQCWHSL